MSLGAIDSQGSRMSGEILVAWSSPLRSGRGITLGGPRAHGGQELSKPLGSPPPRDGKLQRDKAIERGHRDQGCSAADPQSASASVTTFDHLAPPPKLPAVRRSTSIEAPPPIRFLAERAQTFLLDAGINVQCRTKGWKRGPYHPMTRPTNPRSKLLSVAPTDSSEPGS